MRTDGGADEVTTYLNNAVNQMTAETLAGQTTARPYTYDGNGNLLTGAGRAYSYSAANQSCWIAEAPATAAYDSPPAGATTYAGGNQYERLRAGGTNFTDTLLGTLSLTRFDGDGFLTVML